LRAKREKKVVVDPKSLGVKESTKKNTKRKPVAGNQRRGRKRGKRRKTNKGKKKMKDEKNKGEGRGGEERR